MELEPVAGRRDHPDRDPDPGEVLDRLELWQACRDGLMTPEQVVAIIEAPGYDERCRARRLARRNAERPAIDYSQFSDEELERLLVEKEAQLRDRIRAGLAAFWGEVAEVAEFAASNAIIGITGRVRAEWLMIQPSGGG
jgi:hypothetical protein